MASATRLESSRDVYLNLVRLHDRLGAEFTALFREHGITQAQYNVLRILIGAPAEGGSCQYVGERLVTRVPDVTRLIDRMVSAGLVQRSRSEEDRRVVLIRPTAKGRRLCDSLTEPVNDLHGRQLAHLSAKAIAALGASLEDALAAD